MEIIDVWEVKSEDPKGTLIQPSIADVADIVKGLYEDLRTGQSVTLTITKREMTQAQFDAIPDFEGY